MLNVILDPSMIAEEDIIRVVKAIDGVADINSVDLAKRIRKDENAGIFVC